MRCSFLLLALALPACGKSEPKADPAAVEAHLNGIIAREEAEKANAIAESRAREDAREAELENTDSGNAAQ